MARRGFFIHPVLARRRDTVSQCPCFDLHHWFSLLRWVGLSCAPRLSVAARSLEVTMLQAVRRLHPRATAVTALAVLEAVQVLVE
jgi:hypothetical protein